MPIFKMRCGWSAGKKTTATAHSAELHALSQRHTCVHCYVAMSARNSHLSFRLGLRTLSSRLGLRRGLLQRIDRRIRTLSSRRTTTRALGASLLAAAVVAGVRRPSFVFELI